MKAKHTPGPWVRKYGERFRHDQSAGIKANGLYIAATLDMNRTDKDEEVEANACLIAASPELLEACEHLLTVIGNYTGKEIACDRVTEDKWIAEAHAAIAKAKVEQP